MMESVIQPQPQMQRPPETMDPGFLKLGSDLVTKLHVLMRISRTYDPKNAILRQSIQESLKNINSLIHREGHFSLKVLKDDLFLNGQRLRYSVEGFTSYKYFLTQWKARLIGEVTFKEALDEKGLREFVSAFLNLEEGCEENAALFADRLTKQGISSIVVNPLEVIGEEEEALILRRGDQPEVAKRIFFETIGAVKEVMTQIRGQQHADVRKLKRLVQKTIHLITEDESILLGLTTIKNYEGYLFNHSVNVAIYCLAMGRRLGFIREDLTELGMTALLHDIGMSKIPVEILEKPAALNEGERGLTEKHPVMGAEIVLNLKQLGDINPRMIIGIFDHHLKNDLSGYPKLHRGKKASLFGRMIQIADSYDAMTTPKTYKKVPYTPEEALSMMLKKRGSNFDSVLLKIFIGIVGVYPIGSLVSLDSGEMGIVKKTNADPAWMDRPQMVLISPNGQSAEKKEIVDLTEMGGTGRFKRTIIRTLDPHQYDIAITKYFL